MFKNISTFFQKTASSILPNKKARLTAALVLATSPLIAACAPPQGGNYDTARMSSYQQAQYNNQQEEYASRNQEAVEGCKDVFLGSLWVARVCDPSSVRGRDVTNRIVNKVFQHVDVNVRTGDKFKVDGHYRKNKARYYGPSY